MQDPSYQDYPTQQELFGIEFAPPKVRSHGLKEAHTYPLVSQGKPPHLPDAPHDSRY